ncbi:MAG: hypothetical protein KUG81_10335 [Gammaproteobacteria bacterium]|nr:hypothetical protein [Gammaproteobacteria bacterium]
MAAPKRATHAVSHPRLYLAVEGKLTHFEKGKQLTLNGKQAKKLGSRVTPISAGGTADISEPSGD